MLGVETLAVILVVFCASVINGMSGFGFMLVMVPTLSLFLGPVDGVIVANVVSPFQGITMFMLLRQHVRWRTLSTMLAASAFGMPIGIYTLINLPAGATKAVIAVSVMVGAVALWRGITVRRKGRATEAAVGFISGALKTGAGINGPPVVLYMQGSGMEPVPFRATLSAFFLVSNLMALITITFAGQLTADRTVTAVVAIPFLVSGALFGNRLFTRLNPIVFRRIVLGLLVTGSVLVLGTEAIPWLQTNV